MTWLFRLTASALLAGCVVGGAGYVCPVLADLDFDLWRLPEYQERLAHEHQRAEELNRLYQASCDRVLAKQVAGEQLIAGRITLAEATARFRALCLQAPGIMGMACSHHRGRTEEEQICRYTIGWVVDLRAEESEVKEALGRRLEATLDEYLEHYGTVPLP